MMRPIPFALILFAVSFTAARAGGGAWNRAADGYYLKLGFSSLTADREYGFRGEDRPLYRDSLTYRNANFGMTDISFYAEYGFTPWLTGVIATQYSVAVRDVENVTTGVPESESASGLSDTWLSARVRLLPSHWPVAGAATVGVKVPTGSPLKEIPLGTGVVDYEGGLAVGAGFPVLEETYGWAQASAGYRLRNVVEDEINWRVEAGIGIIPTLTFQAVLDGSASTADFEEGADNPGDDLIYSRLVGNQSFTRASGGLIYALSDDTDMNVTYTRTISGINALQAGAFAIGIAWKK